jgi:hypothetical protein
MVPSGILQPTTVTSLFKKGPFGLNYFYRKLFDLKYEFTKFPREMEGCLRNEKLPNDRGVKIFS